MLHIRTMPHFQLCCINKNWPACRPFLLYDKVPTCDMHSCILQLCRAIKLRDKIASVTSVLHCWTSFRTTGKVFCFQNVQQLGRVRSWVKSSRRVPSPVTRRSTGAVAVALDGKTIAVEVVKICSVNERLQTANNRTVQAQSREMTCRCLRRPATS